MLDAAVLALSLATSPGYGESLDPPAIIIQAAAGRYPRMRGRAPHGGVTDLDAPVDVGASDPSVNAGASLPITYTLATLGGTPRYVSPTGSGSTCSNAAPCATITAANTSATAGDPIILKAGTYSNLGNTWSGTAWSTSGVTQEQYITKANIQLYAESGATVILDGATNVVGNTATVEGAYTYYAYTPRPCGNGFGITFCTEGVDDNVNGTDTIAPYNVGKYIDQAWVTSTPYPTSTQLQEVVRKADLAAGMFWVDRTEKLPGTASGSTTTVTGVGTNFTVKFKAGDSITVGTQQRLVATTPVSNTSLAVTVAFSPAIAAGATITRNGNSRIYFMTTDLASATEVAVCNLGDFLQWSGAGGTMTGFKVKRYCNSQAKFGAFDINSTADNLTIRDVVFEDVATLIAAMSGSSTDLLDSVLWDNITITGSNWMGLNPTYNTNATFDGVRITGLDRWNEIASFPQAGAIKTSRTFYTTIKNSFIANNRSQSIWFDQSNYDARVFNNTISNNGVTGEDTCFFWEISDKLRFFNNLVKCPVATAVKIAGSTGAQILNNTIVGGKDAIGIYADSRSRAGCAATGTDSLGVSCGTYSASDRWGATTPARPATMDWLTRLDVLQGNIIVYPTGAGLCGGTALVCVLRKNATATLTLASVLHIAEAGRSIPQTIMDCNVYARTGDTGDLFRAENPSTVGAFIPYASAVAFEAAMDDPAPYPFINNLEFNSLVGAQYVAADGVPTATLTALHATSPCGFPTDAVMNGVIAAGAQHYGVNWQ